MLLMRSGDTLRVNRPRSFPDDPVARPARTAPGDREERVDLVFGVARLFVMQRNVVMLVSFVKFVRPLPFSAKVSFSRATSLAPSYCLPGLEVLVGISADARAIMLPALGQIRTAMVAALSSSRKADEIKSAGGSCGR